MKRSALAVVQFAAAVGLLIAVTLVTLSPQTFPIMSVGSLKCYHTQMEHAC
jgi:hypothetical protein